MKRTSKAYLGDILESIAQMPEEIKNKYVDVQWRDIKDFRNVVAHHYFSINLLRIWDIIEHKLEPLEAQINSI